MEKKIQKLPVRFCTFCGEEMNVNMRSADENMMFYGDQPTIPYGSRYNKKTGEKQYCPHFKCSSYKQKEWYQIGGSPHDNYFLNELWTKKPSGNWEETKK